MINVWILYLNTLKGWHGDGLKRTQGGVNTNVCGGPSFTHTLRLHMQLLLDSTALSPNPKEGSAALRPAVELDSIECGFREEREGFLKL